MTAVPIPHPAVSRHQFRTQVCRLIDRLITVLDEIDGDPDFEPGGDEEPSLGFSEARVYDDQDAMIRLSPIGGIEWLDLEDQCEDEGFDSDREPDGAD